MRHHSLLAQRAVFGGETDCAVGLEFFLHGNVVCCSSAEEYGRAYAFGGKAFAEVEQGRDAGAATYEQNVFAFQTEAVSKRINEVELIADIECSQRPRALADDLDQQRKCVVLSVYVVYRNGSAQHYLLVAWHIDLDKLSWFDFGQLLGMLEHKREVHFIVNLLADNGKIGDIFSHN